MTDNDSGGKLLRDKIEVAFKKSGLKVKHFKLPRDKDKTGKLIKLDPDNCPKEIIKEVKGIIKLKFGSKCFIPAKRLGWSRPEK